jgi:hypothetical protein
VEAELQGGTGLVWREITLEKQVEVVDQMPEKCNVGKLKN